MYRFSNVSYNGMLLSDICEVEEVILPVLPSRSISTLDISSRDGEIYNGKKYDSTEIELTVLIDCDTREEAKDRLRELRELFDVDEPKPFFIDKDRFTLAITSSSIEKEAVGIHSYECTIKLKCCDPYFYSNEVKLAESYDKFIEVTNGGNRPTSPIIEVGFSKDAYFAQLELQQTGEKILVGKYPTLQLSSTTAKSNRVLYDNCETTGSWTISNASIDSDRTVGGTLGITSSGKGVMIGTLPSGGDTTWKGTCIRKNLDHAVDEFKISCNMSHNSTGTSGDPTKPKYKSDKQTVTSGKKTTYYIVTWSILNVRVGAGTSYKKLGSLKKGYKIKNGTETKGWIKFPYSYKDKDGKTINTTGYCSKKGLTKKVEDNRKTTTECNFVVTKKCAIRSSASKTAKNYKTIPVGECIRCITSTTHPSSGDEAGKFYEMAKSYNGYKGYVLISNLTEASDVTFEYDENEDIETSDDKMGLIEVYGFDTNGTQLFKFGMFDDNPYYEHTRPLARIGSKVVLQDPTVVPKPKQNATVSTDNDGKSTIKLTNKLSGRLSDWNEFWGTWTITRKKVKGQYVWDFQVQKIKDGKVIGTPQKSVGLKSSSYPTGALSYIVCYMGTNGTLEKASSVALTHIQIDEINPSETTDNTNVTYFKEGDILEVDCENHRCYLNDIACDDLVDIGSRYFDLQIGENDIKINSNDDGIVAGVVYREKWLGE